MLLSWRPPSKVTKMTKKYSANLVLKVFIPFFAECLTKAPHGEVNADGLSMELLERVFEAQGWDHDMSFKRTELEPFLESLGATGPEKRDTSDAMSQFIAQYRDRSVSNKFPLVRP